MSLAVINRSLSQRFVECLPGDISDNPSPRQTPNVCWSRCYPTPVTYPRLAAHFQEVADLVGLSQSDMRSKECVDWLAGNTTLKNVIPYASCYGGHQFGHWAGQLGDGRAITIAEVEYHQQRWELQLKGAGLTPYSRTADGRAVLRSSVREFLCSEAMHHLGVPTTRALSLITSGEDVIRDILYSGSPAPEPGAIVCRVAPSFIRMGHFEIYAARKENELLKQFVEFTISRDFPHITGNDEQRVAEWFSEVCRSTAKLIVEWQRVGFVHGVMNTDNLSILGLTIDYGPYGWIDNYDPFWTPNTTDAQGRRYRFGNQRNVARWNLMCLANALACVFPDMEIYQQGLEDFDNTFDDGLMKMQCQKFGFIHDRDFTAENAGLISRCYDLLFRSEIDFTNFFIQLTSLDIDNPQPQHFESVFYSNDLRKENEKDFKSWVKHYVHFSKSLPWKREQRLDKMRTANPQFILRNYLAQQAIEKAEEGDFSEVHILMELLKSPYQLPDDKKEYGNKRPDWAKNKVGCSMLSCSS